MTPMHFLSEYLKNIEVHQETYGLSGKILSYDPIFMVVPGIIFHGIRLI